MGLYAAAAAVLAGVESRQGSLKGLVYSSSFQVVGRVQGGRERGRVGERGPGAGEGGARPVLGAARLPLCHAEREAAVRAGVRDAALLGRAGRGDRQRRAPSSREEAAAAPGQGEWRPEAVTRAYVLHLSSGIPIELGQV